MKFKSRQFALGLLVSGLSCLMVPSSLRAATTTWPNLMNYQGRLTNAGGTAVADQAYTVTFNIYNVASSGTALWSETQAVNVNKGLFNAVLGSVNSLATLTPLTATTDLWIGLTVAGDSEMSPRQQLLSAVYAKNAQAVGGLLPNNAANNLVVLDASGKIPAGLVQGGSLTPPFDLTGSSASYNLNVSNTSASSTSQGLKVSAANGILVQATDPSGSGIAAKTAGNDNSSAVAVSGTATNGMGGFFTGLTGAAGTGFMGLWGQTNQNNGRGVEGDAGAAFSNAIGVRGSNAASTGIAVSGAHTGAGQGIGVRGTSATGVGALGVYGTVSGTGGAVGVEGNVGDNGGYGVMGVQSGSSSITYVAGVLGKTINSGVGGAGVRGEGNFGVYGLSAGQCAVCAYNLNTSGAGPVGAGVYATSPSWAIWADSTNTGALGYGIYADVVSTATGSAAGNFVANGASGITYAVLAANNSSNQSSVGVYGTGQHAMQAAGALNGINFYSDDSFRPSFGFYHSDTSAPANGVGIYSTEACTSCQAGYFENTGATGTNAGSALTLKGRLDIQPQTTVNNAGQGGAGVFVVTTGSYSTYTFNNPYISTTSLIFLTTQTNATSSVPAVTARSAGAATITFTPPLIADTTYQFLIIAQ